MTITTTTTATSWSPDEISFHPSDLVPTALLMTVTTVVGAVDGDAPSLRVAYVRDADAATFVPEAGEIPEAEPDLDEVVITTVKSARLSYLSSEQYRQEGTAAEVAQSLARDITALADRALLFNTPGPTGGPTGLLGSGLVDGGTISGSLDGLVDVLAALEENNGDPKYLVVSPRSWATLCRMKVMTGSNQPLIDPNVTTDAPAKVLGLQVIRNRWCPPGKALVIDPRCIASAAGELRAAVSTDERFSSDTIATRLVWRYGWTVVHPTRAAVLNIEDK